MSEKKICRQCGCNEHSEHAKFCHNCSTPLLDNYCSNPRCDLNSNDTDDFIPLPPDYCYCDDCGSETDYFQAGYIKPKNYGQK